MGQRRLATSQKPSHRTTPSMPRALSKSWPRASTSGSSTSTPAPATARRQTVKSCEIGGLRAQAGGGGLAGLQLNQLRARIAKQGRATAASAKPQINIGILGSTTNFHVWHGERSTGRNIHRDALFASYKILSNEPGVQVHIIGEKNLLADDPIIGQLDAILVPHQAAMPQSIKAKLTA